MHVWVSGPPKISTAAGSGYVTMASSGVGIVNFIDGIMNKYVYLDILKRNLKQSDSKLEISGHFKLHQDNDPKHTADIYMLWGLYHCPSVIKSPA
ncbi:uncharacterized protein TNCV_4384001 [Trichonephila clavipes]|nr:uncharacterized protein TNCV_4384001 [Trichonephila clavipes]